ncbi:nuclear transport factor 2 family protein ['Paenibacillus yunnanensis' Narsing Rao et al. 2020]|uniref:nuclear transport factor 2 family protein n=1 Tax=Paenibacillus tengchongensis TaxID=2608684 RepID=UPI00124DC538|nr:nuclear transport factor 2 family protein [Paenibacillus tengchongensis]
METILLPQVIQDFIAAANKPDPEAYVDCFSEDALVLDEGKEWTGKAAITKWSAEHHFGVNITLEPKQDKQHEEETIVVFKVDGDFDKTGLPDPLYLDFYFQIRGHKIKQLAIRLSKE